MLRKCPDFNAQSRVIGLEFCLWSHQHPSMYPQEKTNMFISWPEMCNHTEIKTDHWSICLQLVHKRPVSGAGVILSNYISQFCLCDSRMNKFHGLHSSANETHQGKSRKAIIPNPFFRCSIFSSQDLQFSWRMLLTFQRLCGYYVDCTLFKLHIVVKLKFS